MRLFALLIFSLIVTGASLNDARKANEAFRNGDYERAVELYQQAIDQNPDDARLHFNLGNALSELGRGEEALEAYSRYQSLTENREQQSLADYNAGRTLINNEQYEEAAEYFREALKKNPDDADARYNYELAVKQQQEQEEQQQQNPESGDDENEQDQDQDQDNNQDQNEQNQQEGNNDSNDSESEQQPQDSENRDGEQDQQPSPQNISQEEAESILEALEQLERDLLENQKKVAKESNQKNDKDW